MGYLATWLDWSTINIADYARENSTYSTFYFYWRDELFGRVMRLFDEKTDPVPQREIEVRLMLQGHCAIAPYKGKLTAFFGEPNGISVYFDEKPNYCVHSPVYSENLKIGRDCEMIRNNVLMNPLFDVIHHYAILLAHTEVTYINTAVNARYANGAPVVKNEIQKRGFKKFISKIFNGQYEPFEDLGDMGVEYAGAHLNTAEHVVDLWDARQRILADFMKDIGIKSGLEKRSNTVETEANADTPAMLINLNDMLNERKEGFERVNRHYKTNWTCELNKDIDYVNLFTDPRTAEEKEDEETI